MITNNYLKKMPYVSKISLNSINKINTFLDIAEQSSGEMYLSCGEKIISATSIMGIFTLDLHDSILLFSSISLRSQLMEKQLYVNY
jgi:hypothetical protein